MKMRRTAGDCVDAHGRQYKHGKEYDIPDDRAKLFVSQDPKGWEPLDGVHDRGPSGPPSAEPKTEGGER
jgi:hypothetical protein